MTPMPSSSPALDLQVVSPAVAVVLDKRQDAIMAKESVDGRPPTRRVRLEEWRWLAVAAVVIGLAAVGWMVFRGAGIGSILAMGALFLTLLIVGAAPVLGAGLLRGEEETESRAKSRVGFSQEVIALHQPMQGSVAHGQETRVTETEVLPPEGSHRAGQ